MRLYSWSFNACLNGRRPPETGSHLRLLERISSKTQMEVLQLIKPTREKLTYPIVSQLQ